MNVSGGAEHMFTERLSVLRFKMQRDWTLFRVKRKDYEIAFESRDQEAVKAWYDSLYGYRDSAMSSLNRKVSNFCFRDLPAKDVTPLYGHDCCVFGDTAYFFGGYTRAGELKTLLRFRKDDLRWEVNSDAKWEVIDTPVPARYEHTFTECEGKFYVCFGVGNKNKILADIWLYDPSNESWRELNVVGEFTARSAHSCVCVGHKLYIFGGKGHDGGNLSDVLIFDTRDLSMVRCQLRGGPEGRSGHSAIYWPQGNEMVIFGGQNRSAMLSDVWSLELGRKKWIRRTGVDIGPRAFHRSFLIDNIAVIIGGWIHNARHTVLALNLASDWATVKIKKYGNVPFDICKFGLAQFGRDRFMIFGGGDSLGRNNCSSFCYTCDVKFSLRVGPRVSAPEGQGSYDSIPSFDHEMRRIESLDGTVSISHITGVKQRDRSNSSSDREAPAERKVVAKATGKEDGRKSMANGKDERKNKRDKSKTETKDKTGKGSTKDKKKGKDKTKGMPSKTPPQDAKQKKNQPDKGEEKEREKESQRQKEMELQRRREREKGPEKQREEERTKEKGKVTDKCKGNEEEMEKEKGEEEKEKEQVSGVKSPLSEPRGRSQSLQGGLTPYRRQLDIAVDPVRCVVDSLGPEFLNTSEIFQQTAMRKIKNIVGFQVECAKLTEEIKLLKLIISGGDEGYAEGHPILMKVLDNSGSAARILKVSSNEEPDVIRERINELLGCSGLLLLQIADGTRKELNEENLQEARKEVLFGQRRAIVVIVLS
jgi:hypothetical protein